MKGFRRSASLVASAMAFALGSDFGPAITEARPRRKARYTGAPQAPFADYLTAIPRQARRAADRATTKQLSSEGYKKDRREAAAALKARQRQRELREAAERAPGYVPPLASIYAQTPGHRGRQWDPVSSKYVRFA